MYYSFSYRDKLPWCAYFGRYRQEHPWNHHGKQCPFHLLVYVIDGSAEFHMQDNVCSLHTGDVLLIPENTYYTAETDSFCEYYYFHFSATCKTYETLPDMINNTWGFGYTAEPHSIDTESQAPCILSSHMKFAAYREQLLPLCAKLHHYLHMIVPEAEYEFQLIFSQFLLELSKCVRKDTGTISTVLPQKIIYFIHEHLTESLTLSDIAEYFNISKSYLVKLFRQSLHTSVTAYINRIKMEQAAQLLKTSMMNVSEIAAFLGYHDPAYFSRVFKKHFGESPSKYKS